jgi:hypothetical protein
LNFMFLLACSIFINSVQFKAIVCDANANINHYPNGWWVKLIDEMGKKQLWTLTQSLSLDNTDFDGRI